MAPEDGQSESLRDNAHFFVKPDNPLELQHNYGDNVHILNDPLLLNLIARAGAEGTEPYVLRQAVGLFFQHAFHYVAAQELGTKQAEIPTRMVGDEPERGVYRGPLMNSTEDLVLCSMVRAGDKPSQELSDYLSLATGGSVRLDSMVAERVTHPETGEVTGCRVTGVKISGPVRGKTVLFADPMGATGGTIVKGSNIYKGKDVLPALKFTLGGVEKIIALHLIVAPEYIANMQEQCPDVVIYAGRVDRGLSHPDVLQTRLGTHPTHTRGEPTGRTERGLTDVQYIVPGAGGLGEGLSGELAQQAFY